MVNAQRFQRTARLVLVCSMGFAVAANMAACQVFDGETTDTSDYECPSLMPIMTPDGSCTASLDEALAMVESMDDPELIISPGDYTVSRTITQPITFRSSRARAYARPTLADFEQIECALVSPIVGHGLGAKAMGLEHEPKIILRAADPANGIVIDMADSVKRMTLIGAELHGKEGGPAFTVRKGRIGIVQSRVLSPIKMTGTTSRLFLDGVRMTGAISSLMDGEKIYGEDAWSIYDVGGSCDDALLVVEGGAVVSAVGLELANYSPLGLCVNNARATLCGGSIHDIDPDDEERLGRGAYVRGGGTLALRGVDLYAVYEVGVWADGNGTELTLEEGAAISDVDQYTDADLQMSAGIIVSDGAAISAEGATISDIEGVGIWLTGDASATIDDMAITSVQAGGIAVFDATLALSSSSIDGVVPQSNAGGGFGIYIDPLALGAGAVEVSDTTIADSESAGIFVNGEGSDVSVSGGAISGSISSDSRHMDGFGIAAIDVCSGLDISGVAFEDNYNAHIILHSSNASLGAIAFRSTGCGYADFVQQGCTAACVTILSNSDLGVAGISDPPNTIELCPFYDHAVIYDELTINLTIAPVESG